MFYLIYSLLFFFIGLLVVNYNLNNKIAQYWYYFGIVLFWGMAYHYAVDTANYMQYFYCDVYPIWKGLFLHAGEFEVGFNFVSQICKTISSQYIVYQMLFFGLIMLLIIKGFQRLFDEKPLVFIIPLLFFLYPMMLNAFRQGVAVAIFIFALSYIDEKQSWRYFLCVFIAFLFHQSAIFLIVVYFARFAKVIMSKDMLVFAVLLACDILWIMGISVSSNIPFIADFLSETIDMGNKYVEIYLKDEAIHSGAGLAKLIEVNITVILYTIFCKKEKNYELFRYNLLIYVVLMLTFGGLFAHRLIYFFMIPYYICFIRGIMALCERVNKKIVFSGRINLMNVLGYSFIAVYMIWFFVFHSDLITRDYLFLPTNMIEITNHNYDLL